MVAARGGPRRRRGGVRQLAGRRGARSQRRRAARLRRRRRRACRGTSRCAPGGPTRRAAPTCPATPCMAVHGDDVADRARGRRRVGRPQAAGAGRGHARRGRRREVLVVRHAVSGRLAHLTHWRRDRPRHRDPRLDRLHRHPGARPRPRQPRPVPRRRPHRRRVQPRALRGAGRRVRARLLRARGGGLDRGRRPRVRRRAQRHHRRRRAAPDAGRARRRHDPGAGQQGVPDHGRLAGHRPRQARPDRAGRLRALARWRSACAPARPARYAASC